MEYERLVDWDACAVEESPGSEVLDLSDCLDDPGYHGGCLDAVVDVQRCADYAPFTVSSPHFFQVNKFPQNKF